MNKLYLLGQLIFAPSSFVQIAADADLKAKLFGSRESAHELARDRVRTIRTKQAKALLQTVILVMGGSATAFAINEYLSLSPTNVLWARLLGATILAWATLGRMGWELQSMAGTTLAEQVHTFAFRFFYSVGVFATVLALLLRAT